MEQTGEQAGTKSTKQLVEQINAWLRSGNYSRALDVLRGAGLEFPDDAELAELERVAQDGLQRKTEADRLITESQELFARQKFAEAIQLLREAYELDKKNSLARAILANALVEHANSLVETDWLEAEKLCNQALSLNPAHPTAKTVRNLIVNLKPTISVEDWVAKARKLQSAGDLFAALAWVAEGLAVHPEDPKLLQVQDAIQRDQGAQRRQARRLDVKELQRMEAEINKAADVVAKQALAERIQGLAAKYWTDGEVLAIANGLLLRLGLVPQGSSPASPHGKGAAVIFHVPRPVAPKPSAAPGSQIQASPAPEGKVSTSAVTPSTLSPTAVPPTPAPTRAVPTTSAPPATAPPRKAPSAPPVPKPVPSQVTVAPVVALPASPAKVISRSTVRTQSKRSNSRTLVFISVAAMILVATIFFVVRKHDTPTTAKAPAAASSVSAPVTTPETSAPNASAPAEIPPEQSQSALPIPPDASTEAVTPEEQPPADSSHDVGTLVVVAGQDDARVLLNGKPQRQLTRAGQLRIPNLALHGYVVQVTKAGFQDPPQ